MTSEKVAFVTGAASGLGFATAQAFIGAGYATVMVDLDPESGTAAAERLNGNGRAVFFQCDVSEDSSVEAAVNFTMSTFGRIDAAFNAAGIAGNNLPINEVDHSHYDRVIAVNLTGVWNCTRHQMRAMLPQGRGTIVNCSSGAGKRGVANNAAYTASKHGVIGITRAVALEAAPQGIRVNAICPGLIDTPMSSSALSPAYRDQILAMIPRRRMGHADDIAAAVLWLCSEQSDYVVGQALSIDGGAG